MSIEVAIDLFGNPIHPAYNLKNKTGQFKNNPCIPCYGKGPEGTKCKTCALLIKKYFNGKTYNKCSLRGNNNSVGTDHKVSWPTCGKYKEGKNGLDE